MLLKETLCSSSSPDRDYRSASLSAPVTVYKMEGSEQKREKKTTLMGLRHLFPFREVMRKNSPITVFCPGNTRTPSDLDRGVSARRFTTVYKDMKECVVAHVEDSQTKAGWERRRTLMDRRRPLAV